MTTFFSAEEAPIATESVQHVSVARSNYRLCDGLTLRSPVVQATLGPCDSPRLAAAVSRAGGLGSLSVPSTTDINALRLRLTRVQQRTTRPILLVFTDEFESESLLETALALGFRHFQVFWWNGPRLARRIHEAGGTVFWQVGTAGQGGDALHCGADVLIAQGTQAGGQVRSPQPLDELVAALLALRGDGSVSVVAGGGLANRQDVEAVLSWGASAAMLGTRFLLSEESFAPVRDKNRLARANANRLLLDTRLLGNWPCAPRRRLGTWRGIDIPSLYAGCGLGHINEVWPAAQIVRALTPIYRSGQSTSHLLQV